MEKSFDEDRLILREFLLDCPKRVQSEVRAKITEACCVSYHTSKNWFSKCCKRKKPFTNRDRVALNRLSREYLNRDIFTIIP